MNTPSMDHNMHQCC